MAKFGFVMNCAVVSILLGGAWGLFIYHFDEPAGWVIGVALTFFVFFYLVRVGWNPDQYVKDTQHNRRFDD